jgi:hypothetical protein
VEIEMLVLDIVKFLDNPANTSISDSISNTTVDLSGRTFVVEWGAYDADLYEVVNGQSALGPSPTYTIPDGAVENGFTEYVGSYVKTYDLQSDYYGSSGTYAVADVPFAILDAVVNASDGTSDGQTIAVTIAEGGLEVVDTYTDTGDSSTYRIVELTSDDIAGSTVGGSAAAVGTYAIKRGTAEGSYELREFNLANADYEAGSTWQSLGGALATVEKVEGQALFMTVVDNDPDPFTPTAEAQVLPLSQLTPWDLMEMLDAPFPPDVQSFSLIASYDPNTGTLGPLYANTVNLSGSTPTETIEYYAAVDVPTDAAADIPVYTLAADEVQAGVPAGDYVFLFEANDDNSVGRIVLQEVFED